MTRRVLSLAVCAGLLVTALLIAVATRSAREVQTPRFADSAETRETRAADASGADTAPVPRPAPAATDAPPPAGVTPEIAAQARACYEQFVTVMPEEVPPAPQRPAVDDSLAAFTRLREPLAGSTVLEDRYVAAFIVIDPDAQARAVAGLASEPTSDPVLLWHGLHACSGLANDERDCALRDLEAHALGVDGQNSETWIRVAANRWQDGDEAAALEALRQAGSVAESRDYFVETVEMAARALAANAGIDTDERNMTAFSIAGTTQPKYADYMTMCREAAEQSPRWARACRAYGARVGARPGASIRRLIALAIEANALDALGETATAEATRARSDELRARLRPAPGTFAGAIDALLLTSPRHFDAFLETFRQHGELEARRRVQANGPAMLGDLGLDACVPLLELD